MWKFKRGIALLITLFFVIAITLSIGIAMGHIQKAKNDIESENFMLQTSVVLDDVMSMLKGAKELDAIVEDTTGVYFDLFLAQSSLIPFENGDVKVALSITSARSKINPNQFRDANTSLIDQQQIEAFREYLSIKNVSYGYADLFVDAMNGVKIDGTYLSDIFYENPYLFRSYLASFSHLDKINRFFMKSYNENTLKNINFENLFYLSPLKSYAIDLNQATQETWEFMLGTDPVRAEELALMGGSYDANNSTLLSPDEKERLAKFNTSYFEPFINVEVEIMRGSQVAKIRFEYDMKQKKGSNFAYEI